MFREIAILGSGLLGGSLALALQGKAHVRLWGRRPEVIAGAGRIADLATTDLAHAVAGADLVIFCTPVETMAELAWKILPNVGSATVLTDVGSVKVKVLQEVAPIFAETGHFVGSHPMAGSEQTGLEAARADLFAGAVCILTPAEDTDADALAAVSRFWISLGCQIFSMTAAEHDRRVGLISHLPHLTAASLANAVEGDSLELAGQGLRDTTRIASGPSSMWTGILLANQENVRAGIRQLIGHLQAAETLLETGDEAGLRNFLATAKTIRDSIPDKKNHGGIQS